MYQEHFMQRAIDLSSKALRAPGTEPFGAVVVRDGVVVGEGYAASLAQSAEAFAGVPTAARHPIDVEDLRAEAGAPLAGRATPSEQRLDREAVTVLEAWAAGRRPDKS